MQVGEDPGPVGERIAVAAACPLAPAEAAVDLLELAGDGGEALRLGRRARLAALPLAQLVVLGQALRARPRRARAARARPADRRARRRRPPPRGAAAPSPSAPGRRSPASASTAARASAVRPERTRTRSRSASGIPGRVESGFVRSSTASQPGSSRSERSAARATGSEPEVQLDHDELPLRAGPEELGVDAGRDDPVVAREALRRRGRGRLRRGDQRVDAGQQLLAQRPPRRVAEPVGREEARDAERLASRAGRGTRCSAARARSRGRRRSRPAAARAGGSRARRPGRRGSSAARPARPFRSRSSPRPRRARARAARRRGRRRGPTGRAR